MFMVILTEKGGHFGRKRYSFLRDFSRNIGPFFYNFQVSAFEILEKQTHVKGFLVKMLPIIAAHPHMSQYVIIPNPLGFNLFKTGAPILLCIFTKSALFADFKFYVHQTGGHRNS